MQDDLYKRVSSRIDADWYPYHENEWFTHTDICAFFEWRDQETRKCVSKKLYHESSEAKPAKLEKRGKGYRIIDRSVDTLDWVSADVNAVYKLGLPYGIYDGTHFDFEENVSIPPKGIVLVAGVSNEGKTAFCLNMLVSNMDKHNVTYFTCEYTEIGFKRRMEGFEWCELTDSDGQPKFRTVLRYDNYHDVVDPDGFNIIDYLDVNEEAEYYKLVPYIKRIQKALGAGIAIIALQKPPNRPDAFGGSNLRGAASLYVAIDKGKLRVVKAKDWTKENPNGKVYAFSLTGGNVFGNIHEIVEDDNL